MSDLRPMLATSADHPPEGEGWQYEFKWDGVRLIVVVDPDGIRCLSRNLNDLTTSWPELTGLPGAVGGRAATFDAEIVVMGERGAPDFGLLQRRLHVSDPSTAAKLAQELPATLMVFDLLDFDGLDLRNLPLADRRRLLEGLELDGPAWKVPPVFEGDGAATLHAARSLHLEGIVAKRLESIYTPGRRADAWRKIKLLQRDEFAVLGYTPGAGRRSGAFGSLTIGVVDLDAWRCVGSVGTGFDDRTLTDLGTRLAARRVESPTWTAGPVRREVVPVEPELVVEVAYSGWTRDGVLRHPAYVGLRTDRLPEEIVAPPSAPFS